jgi:thiol-disulfide isomerase/thioredoxin
VTAGLIALAAAVAAASMLGLALRRRSGRFRLQAGRGDAADRAAPAGQGGPAAARPARGGTVLTEADLGARLGERATLVQFSTVFCAACPATRRTLAQVAEMADGVAHVEIDAVARLDLAQRLRIASTPTVLVLGPDGAVVGRAVGQPRKADVIAALAAVPRPGPPAG